MKSILRISVFAFITAFTANAAAAVAVIVHPSNTVSLSQTDIERMYLGKVNSFPAGGRVTPLNLPEGTPTRTEFDQAVVGKSASQLKAFWAKQVFTGKGTPPEELAGASAMKSRVSSDPSALGYLDPAEVDDSVRVIGTY